MMELKSEKSAKLGVNFRQSNNPAVIAVLLVIVIALVFWFLLLPKQKEVSTAKSSLKNLQEQSSKYEENLKNLQGISYWST